MKNQTRILVALAEALNALEDASGGKPTKAKTAIRGALDALVLEHPVAVAQAADVAVLREAWANEDALVKAWPKFVDLAVAAAPFGYRRAAATLADDGELVLFDDGRAGLKSKNGSIYLAPR